MSKWYAGVPSAKFHQKMSLQICFKAGKLTLLELEKPWRLFLLLCRANPKLCVGSNLNSVPRSRPGTPWCFGIGRR